MIPTLLIFLFLFYVLLLCVWALMSHFKVVTYLTLSVELRISFEYAAKGYDENITYLLEITVILSFHGYRSEVFGNTILYIFYFHKRHETIWFGIDILGILSCLLIKKLLMKNFRNGVTLMHKLSRFFSLLNYSVFVH